MPISFREKVNQLPEAVKKVLFSASASEETYKIITSYVSDNQIQNKITKLIGLILVKDVPLERMAEIIQRELALAEGVSMGLAAALTKINFLPIKEHFPNVETLIATWSQKATPPTFPPQSLGIAVEEEKPAQATIQGQSQTAAPEPEIVVRQTLASALFEKEEALSKQLITVNPIKFADSEMLKFPSVKNWLTDYLKFRNNFPNQEYSLIRARYINDTPNTKGLSEREKLILAQIFRSYDEYTALPFSQKTGLLLIDKLELPPSAPPKQAPAAPVPPPPTQMPPKIPTQSTTPPTPPPPAAPAPTMPSPPPLQSQRPTQPSQPPGALPTEQPAPPPPTLPPSPPPSSPPQKDTYREQVAPQDLAGPQAFQRPAPKLNGNVINLKDVGSWQQ